MIIFLNLFYFDNRFSPSFPVPLALVQEKKIPTQEKKVAVEATFFRKNQIVIANCSISRKDFSKNIRKSAYFLTIILKNISDC